MDNVALWRATGLAAPATARYVFAAAGERAQRVPIRAAVRIPLDFIDITSFITTTGRRTLNFTVPGGHEALRPVHAPARWPVASGGLPRLDLCAVPAHHVAGVLLLDDGDLAVQLADADGNPCAWMAHEQLNYLRSQLRRTVGRRPHSRRELMALRRARHSSLVSAHWQELFTNLLHTAALPPEHALWTIDTLADPVRRGSFRTAITTLEQAVRAFAREQLTL